jgi:hypothetical protein
MNIILVLLLFVSTASSAELYELKYPSDSIFLKNIWVPVLKIDGWHQDKKHTLMLHSNVHVPDGTNYLNTTSFIHANAINKKQHPELISISDFINIYYKEFSSLPPNSVINEVDRIYTADGMQLLSYTVFPTSAFSVAHAKDGLWQRVTYGEEGNFYIVFTLVARTEAAYKSALPTYLQSLSKYSEKP